MPGADWAAAQPARRPRPPDRLGVAVDADVVAGGGEQQHRAPDLPASGSVGLLVLPVGTKAGPVVLAHAVHDGRIPQRGLHVGAVIIAALYPDRGPGPALARPQVWAGPPRAVPKPCPRNRRRHQMYIGIGTVVLIVIVVLVVLALRR